MKFLSFFKHANKTGQDTIIHSSELENSCESNVSESKEIVTELCIPKEWEVSKEQEYVLKFLSNDLPPLKPGQLSLTAINIQEDPNNGDWNVQAFLRSSLNQPFKFGKTNLLLLDSNDQVLASQEFDLSLTGPFTPYTDNPRIFTFSRKNIKSFEVPGNDWKITFEVHSILPHKLELDPQWERGLPTTKKEALAELIRKLPPLKPQEINITGFQTSFINNGDLSVSLIIRNGQSNQIELYELPLEVTDANNKTVSKGKFKLDKLIIKANTSKPWNFIFPKQMLQSQNPDFSRWTVKIPS